MLKITENEFKQILAKQCLSSGGAGLPRKDRDKQVVYKSILMTIDTARTYSEKELNEALKKWLADVGRNIETDHVNLRRTLIDERYLTRDPAGTEYQVNTDIIADLFEPDVDSIDPVAVIEEAIKLKEERRAKYQNK